jgi:hypothetical protein
MAGNLKKNGKNSYGLAVEWWNISVMALYPKIPN